MSSIKNLKKIKFKRHEFDHQTEVTAVYFTPAVQCERIYKEESFSFFCVYNKYELTCFVDPASLCLQATISALCVTALCTSYF